jgi:LAO/AO transport system kinase
MAAMKSQSVARSPERTGGPSLEAYVDGLMAGDRAMLGRAITLIESRRPDHQAMAQELLIRVLPKTGLSTRVGITGVPGAGKSSLIETLGCHLIGHGRRVAVLAIDPSSQVTGGSILGDKTRMARLATEADAFIRPSPSGGTLGGVARKTRESMLLCEAAGYDAILVETVGVGQSETVVSDMVDFFLVLALAGAGDELQGIKRGVLELADLIAVNKADGDNADRAERAAQQYRSVLRFMRPHNPNWATEVLTCSAARNTNVDRIWEKIEEYVARMKTLGRLEQIRRRQLIRWMWGTIEDQLMTALRHRPAVKRLAPEVEAEVLEGHLTPTLGARRILEAFGLDGDGLRRGEGSARP